jgi:hypothetical protein
LHRHPHLVLSLDRLHHHHLGYNIALLGNYLASTFVASSDGHGGTSIIDPPATTWNNPLAPSQHA